MIIFGNFEPDRLIYANDASVNVVNCIPVADGWGPLKRLVPVSEPLPEAFRGGVYVRTETGAYRIFAGTETKLFELDPDSKVWNDISRTGDPYGVPDGDDWWFIVFGSYLIAGNLANEPQFIDINSGTEFADLPGSPPKARYAWIAGTQIVLANLTGYSNRIMTSGIGDAEWWTPGRRGCDFQDFPDGEEIVGGVGAQAGAVIFQRTKIRSMTMMPGDVPFRTDVLNSERGVAAPRSIAQTGPGQFVYLSKDGFFAGVEGRAIGLERVDRWFLDAIQTTNINFIKSMVDPINKIVWWEAPLPGDERFLVGYCWPLDRWCYATAAITGIASLVTLGITIDGLDDLYEQMDDIDLPYDSALFTGGVPTLVAFDNENRMCYFAGNNMAATLETPDVQLTVGRRSFVSGCRLVGDMNDSYTMSVTTSDRHGGSRTTSTARYAHSQTGIVPFRHESMFHSFRVDLANGAQWKHISGIDFPEGCVVPGGWR